MIVKNVSQYLRKESNIHLNRNLVRLRSKWKAVCASCFSFSAAAYLSVYSPSGLEMRARSLKTKMRAEPRYHLMECRSPQRSVSTRHGSVTVSPTSPVRSVAGRPANTTRTCLYSLWEKVAIVCSSDKMIYQLTVNVYNKRSVSTNAIIVQ